VVADGMGGHHAGEVASALGVASIEAFALHILRRFSNLAVADEQSVERDFQEALRQADARLCEEAAHHPQFAGMGTTLTLAFATGRRLFVIHAGDSRCYLFRSGKLQQLTIDQTIAAELARRGVIKPEQVSHHQFRHMVTSYLGGMTRSETGMEIFVGKADLQAGDVMLLCSDGLTEMVADDRIAKILAAEREPRVACERLVAEANKEGGKDNVTVIVARFEAI
jgi:protein phosphatase